MEILGQPQGGVSVPEHQPPPSQKYPASPEPLASGSKPHLLYKCLLKQHAQKLKKSLPVFNTQNEGSEHMPKFKSTVSFDGLRFTSTNTFQQRKMAEMDVSRIAYITITQKFKSDAMQFTREDKTFCKSILMEIAAKMNLGRPEYETSQLGTLIPAFRSSLVFNGVAYQGDDGKTKKESEQLAARVVILKYLDSESGLDVAEIVNCKLRQSVVMNKIQERSNFHNGLNVSLSEPKSELGISTVQNLPPGVTQSHAHEISINKIQEMSNGHNGSNVALIEPKAELGIGTVQNLPPGVTQSRAHEVSINKIQEMSNGHNGSNVALIEPKAELGIGTVQNLPPGVTQSRVREASINKIQEMSNGHNGLNAALIEPRAELGITTMQNLPPLVTQSRVQEAPIETITQAVHVVTQLPIPEVSIAPTMPAISVAPVAPDVSIVNQPPIPEVFFKKIMPTVPAPVILTQSASADINNSATPFVVSTPSLGTLSSIPATPLASNVIQPANSVASLPLASESLEYIPLTVQTSGKKRRRKNKKNAQKRMCLSCLHDQKEIPVLPPTQAHPFSSQ